MDRMALPARRLIAVALICVASFGLRETLGQDGESVYLGGTTAASACGALTLEYAVDYAPAIGAFAVTGADIEGLTASCAGRTVRVSFTAANGTSLGTATARVVVPTTMASLTGRAVIDVGAVAGVSVAVLS
jgi:hypothetical protein